MTSLIRTLSFLSSWLSEFLRQPLLLAGLLLGPFLVLFAFAGGVDVSRVKPDVIVVSAGEEQQPLQPLPDELTEHINVVEQTTDLNAAIRRLRNGEVDAVAIIPPDPEGAITSGESIPIQIFTNEVDPLRHEFTRAYLADQVSQINQATLAEAITEAQASIADVDEYITTAREYIELARAAGNDVDTVREQVAEVRAILGPLEQAAEAAVVAASGVSFVLPGIGVPRDEVARLEARVAEVVSAVDAIEGRLNGNNGTVPSDAEFARLEEILIDIGELAETFRAIPAEVLAEPFVLELENVAPVNPTFGAYYGPAVLVLLIQHMAISLGALSMTRIRILGLTELLRVAPIRPVEIVNGSYLSYGVVTLATGFAILGLMYFLVGVPIVGSLLYVAAIIVLLTLASLGVGFVAALLTRSEQQATNVAMLILLAAVFFSGLIVALERLTWPAKAVSYALPSTYALSASHDVMLRGVLRQPLDLLVLAVVAVVLYLITFIFLRRELRPG